MTDAIAQFADRIDNGELPISQLWARRPRLTKQARMIAKWDRACRDVLGHPLKIDDIEPVLAGHRLDVTIPIGTSDKQISANVDKLAVALRCRELRVVRHVDNASLATITVLYGDPFAITRPWPNLHADTHSLWEPIPAGFDTNDQPVTLELYRPGHGCRHLLIGGQTGGGKSVALMQTVATAALDPNTTLKLIDRKQVEFARWTGSADQVAYTLPDSITMLDDVNTILDERQQQLADLGLVQINPDSAGRWCAS